MRKILEILGIVYLVFLTGVIAVFVLFVFTCSALVKHSLDKSELDRSQQKNWHLDSSPVLEVPKVPTSPTIPLKHFY